MSRVAMALVAAVLAAYSAAASDSLSVRLHAAGSLRAALTDIGKAYEDAYGVAVTVTFGGSGLLKDRLAAGEAGDVFASADMGNPLSLSRAGKSGPTVLFAHNHMCAFLRPGLKATSSSILATLLDPSIKVGTSTPISDPAGDYAWALFKKADSVRPGSRATLEAKAVKIGNVPGSLAVPSGVTNAVAWLFKEKRADVFLAYCTGGAAVAKELPGTTTLVLPPALAIEANYGLTILNSSNQDRAAQLALFILSPAGQKILADHGFDAPLVIPR
ncbi:MAG TPA: molybdate ABC transporter substrate-binding protein [Steroidobacteraceae bacterium]